MTVLLSGEDAQALHAAGADVVRRQHALNCSLHNARRILGMYLLCRSGTQATGKLRMVDVLFLRPLLAGEVDFRGVRNNDIVARVGVRRVIGLVLTHQDSGYARREPAEGLAFGVREVPGAIYAIL